MKRIENGQVQAVSDGTVGLVQGALDIEGVRSLCDDGGGPGIRLPARWARAVGVAMPPAASDIDRVRFIGLDF